MISHKHKCILVHIPKTGGTSIEKIIWPNVRNRKGLLWMGFKDKYHNKYQTGGMQHLLASQIKQEVGGDIFDSYFKFAFVRNPWDKAVSQFTYMRSRKDLRDFIGMKQNDGLKRYLSLIQKKTHVQWEHQHKFVMDDNGDLMINFLGCFTFFEKDVRHILKVLNINNATIPHIMRTHHKPYRQHYDQESREMVYEMYKVDVETFNFTF